MKNVMKQPMKKLLVSTLMLAGVAHAETFEAGGTEPGWSLTLTKLHGYQYKAVLSSAMKDDNISTIVRATVTRNPHRYFSTYSGRGSDGRPFSIIAIEQNCVGDGKGDTFSHVVVVNDHYEGCGGKVLIDSDAGEQGHADHNNQHNPVNSARAKAKKLNAQGYHWYKQGRYTKALPLFNRARAADSSYAVAHYNFACTASILSRKYQCLTSNQMQNMVTLNKTVKALKQAIRLEPKRKAKSQTDPDLKALRKTYAYYRDVLHYSHRNNTQFQRILRGLDWTQAGNFYAHHGKPVKLTFKGNHVVTVRWNERSSDSSETRDKTRYKNGTYRVHGGKVTITYKGQTTTGRFVVDPDFGAMLKFSGNVLPYDDFSANANFGVDNCDN